MKNVKYRGFPRQKDEFRGEFRGSKPRKKPKSAARLEIPRSPFLHEIGKYKLKVLAGLDHVRAHSFSRNLGFREIWVFPRFFEPRIFFFSAGFVIYPGI